MRKVRPIAERFSNHVTITDDPNACQIWNGAKITGYGVLREWTGERWRNVFAHRFSYEQANGAIPDGLQLDHLCRTRACVNPAHLEPVTGKENRRRGQSFDGVNARKTHCKNGHPFSGDNLRMRPDGKRACRTCEAAYSHAVYERRKANGYFDRR